MDKKYEDMSYREVHKQLEEAMQDALTSDEAGPFGSPEIDYSFMDGKPEKKTHRISGMSRFNKVAAIIVIALLGMNVVMMATGAGVSYSEKGLLHRIYEGARGIFTDEDESKYVEIDETGESHIITDIEELEYAKKFCPNIYIPDYIPDDFMFESLYIEKRQMGYYWAQYKYLNNNEKLNIEITNLIGDEKQIKSIDKGSVINLIDRKVNIYQDDMEKYYIADIYFEDATIYICGNVSFHEIREIALTIEK